MLLENIRIFRAHAEVLRDYQRRFKFILVDEYQDTNVAQYLWLRLLAQSPSEQAGEEGSVIPGRREAANPESIVPALGLWIPGSSLRPAPE